MPDCDGNTTTGLLSSNDSMTPQATEIRCLIHFKPDQLELPALLMQILMLRACRVLIQVLFLCYVDPLVYCVVLLASAPTLRNVNRSAWVLQVRMCRQSRGKAMVRRVESE